uniref:biotin--[biotin carboxyl-carrier protein] ligase n=1 Tax=uncultured Chloroflexi bacterium HF0500_03M05 TaxID=710737 RepID=E0XY59_9CHLR|nr:biotin-(acetyl-CoA carboxylase) ligase [uncultured Chloroflexi bacterium HF0500_03M05]
MDEARMLADNGAPEGTVVIAREQTTGRGRFKRSWISPSGRNILFSVVFRPSSAQLNYVNMAATLAVSRAVASLTGLKTSVKWPNDVRINGRKVAGILIETAIEMEKPHFAIVGIGLNVNLVPSEYPEIAAIATSLYVETGRMHDMTGVLLAVLEQLDDLYGEVLQGRSLTDEWSVELETLGRMVRVQWRDQLFDGRAISVDEQGNLLLLNADGSTVTVVAGEVTLQI